MIDVDDSLLDFVFKKCYALAMIKQIEGIIMNNCLGCHTSSTWNHQHSCMNDTVAKDSSKYWTQAQFALCHGGIIFEFLTRCEAESLPVDSYVTLEAINKSQNEWEEDIRILVNIMAYRSFL